MHILVPTGIFHPESGGPATYLYRFLPELLQRGHTVEVVTFGEGQTDSYSYPVTRIPRTNIFHRNWLYYRAVKEKLPRADMVFINSLGIPLPRIHQPTVLKVVGDRAWERAVNRGWIPPTEDIDHFQTAHYGVKVKYVKYSRSREARRVRQVIVPSHYLRQMVIGWGVPAERVTTIYNALESLPSEPVTRQTLQLPEGKPLLLTAARLTAWKGVDAILQAIESLPDIMLLIAGDGPMLAELKQQAQSLNLAARVRFLGKIPHTELVKYYQVADYTILYSGYEGLSHVLLESLSAGTPVIASDKCGNPELVQDGQNGFLVPYPNVDALRTVITRAFEGDTPQRLRQNPLLDREKFSWARLVEETVKVLHDALSG